MQRETWVGIAWAVGLFAAMAAVFAYEAATFELDEFHVAWMEESGQMAEVTRTLNVGQMHEHTFSLDDATNVTYVEVAVTWNDPNGGDDSFSLEVVAPNGSESAQGATGRVVVRFDGVSVPTQEHVRGVDLEHAKATGLPEASSADGLVGDWLVRVTLQSAPPVADGGTTGTVTGCQSPANNNCDGANAYTVTWRVVRYHATFPSDDEAHAA